MVEAVPITAQVPAVVASLPSTSEISLSSTLPARYCAQKRRQSVQAPSRSPRWRPVIIGPATSITAGRPAETAPINCAGTVLSQPPISTTASMGCARTISSVSIDIRLRNFRLVGLRNTSPSEMVGKFDRQGAGRQHAALDRVQQFREMAVAIVEARWRIGDADHRLFQHGGGIAHRAGERTPQIKREIAVAVIGQAVGDAGGFFAHAELFCSRARPDASHSDNG